MLNFSLTAISRGEVTVQGELSPNDPVWEDADLALAEPVRVDLRAHSVGQGVLVRGRIHTRLELECRRCLTPVDHEIDEVVSLLFEPVSDLDEEAELSGEVYPLPERGDLVDLRPALREQVLLQVPEHVVCDEACKGLCPGCGADLNGTTCACVPASEPGPWDALKKLKFD